MPMKESAEMYLETIYTLSQVHPHVRSVDVAETLGYTRPSVSRAVNMLKQGRYLNMDTDGFLTLTDSGREIAEKIYERHMILTKALMALGIDEKTASEDACKIEHHISDKAFEAIKTHINQYTT